MERPLLVYLLVVAGLVVLALGRARIERRGRLKRLFEILGWAEIGIITVLLGALVFFGCLQIVLRNFFDRGIIWADPLMRHIVLWLGCMGGAVATSRVRHITVDALSRYLTGRLAAFRDRVIHLATAVASSLLGMAALGLVLQEKEYGGEAFLSVDTWQLQVILPLAFFVVTYRSLLNALLGQKPAPLEWEEARPGRPRDA